MSISFNEYLQTNEESLLIVDGLNLAFRYRDEAESFHTQYIKTVRSLANSYKCGKIVVASDQGSSSFRKSIYPEYKQNRKAKYDTQTEEEKEKFKRFFNNWEECLDILAQEFTVLRFPGVEADDIIGYVVKNRRAYGLAQVWIASSDKDLDLLITEGVSRFSYVTRKETTLETWDDMYGWSREQYVDIKCLMGDSGDNIKGVEGIGPKRALSIVNEHGSIMDILDNMPIPGKQKFIQSLNNSEERLALNLQLVDILTFCEDAIGKENLAKIDEVFL